MKATNKIHQSIQLMFLAIIAIPAATLFFSSCEKEKIYVEVPTEVIVEVPIEVSNDTCNRPNEENDLIAFLHPLEGVLFTAPEYFDIALEQLNAQPSSDGTFSMKGVNIVGDYVEINFIVQPIGQNELFNISQEVEKQTPDLVKEFEEKGTKYRVYKNAKCGNVKPGFTGPCEKNDDGSSYHNVWYAASRCERGNAFCVEVYANYGRRVVFMNDNCQGIIQKEEPYYNWVCQ